MPGVSTPPKAFETVKYREDGPVAVLELHRPERKNSMSRELLREVDSVLIHVEESPDLRVLVITGQNDCFSAGGDLKELANIERPVEMAYAVRNTIDHIERLDKPTIAAIGGWCLAGGLEMALCCDLRVASETARIGDAHIKRGGVGGAAVAARLTKTIGAARTKQFLFLGGWIDGKGAVELGLANWVFPENSYLDEAIAIGQRIAEFSPSALAKAKRLVNAAVSADLHEAVYISNLATDEGLLAQGIERSRANHQREAND